MRWLALILRLSVRVLACVVVVCVVLVLRIPGWTIVDISEFRTYEALRQAANPAVGMECSVQPSRRAQPRWRILGLAYVGPPQEYEVVVAVYAVPDALVRIRSARIEIDGRSLPLATWASAGRPHEGWWRASFETHSVHFDHPAPIEPEATNIDVSVDVEVRVRGATHRTSATFKLHRVRWRMLVPSLNGNDR